MYQHKSGHRKRQEKAAKDKDAAKGQTLLSQHFVSRGSHDADPGGTPSGESDSGNIVAVAMESEGVEAPNSSDQEMPLVPEVPIAATGGPPSTSSDQGPREATTTDGSSLPYSDSPKEGQTVGKRADYDLGELLAISPSPTEIREAVVRGPAKHPSAFPKDSNGRNFPVSLLHVDLPNGEKVPRDWLVWSRSKQGLHCFCCRLFYFGPANTKPLLAEPCGVSNKDWKKLYDRVNDHHKSPIHRDCYVKWRALQTRLNQEAAIDETLNKAIETERQTWRKILHRILDVTLFLAERGLAFRGSTEEIGDPRNGNFLGILELLARYDDVLRIHLDKVKRGREEGKPERVTYLSWKIQNEFIECCGARVRNEILEEIRKSKYYSIIVDSTTDVSHIEQHVFVIRLLKEVNGVFKIEERFLEFVDGCDKTGEEMDELIVKRLEHHKIPEPNCRGQGYDNARNVTGEKKGTGTRFL